MKKYIIVIISFIGTLGFFSSCEKEGDKLMLSDSNIKVPTLTLPDLNYTRAQGANALVFKGTPVNPGYKVSAKYFLEACAKGNEFKDVIELYSGEDCNKMTITVGEINQKMLKNFPEDTKSSVDFRLRSVLTVDAGTGAQGTGDKLFVYNSATKTADITLYGLLRLDLIGSGMEQKIVSPAGDGKYNRFVKLDPTKPFTLKDPETNKVYGGATGTLTENGVGIAVGEAGWYDLNVDIKALTYEATPYFIGCVGSATPNGWDAPDQKMDYDVATNTWRINLDLVEGAIKFRRNDGWSWNMGFADGETPVMKDNVIKGNLKQGGVGNDIPIPVAGNYDIIFTILSDDAGTYEIIKK